MKTFANIAVALPAGEPFELVWLHGIKPAFQEMAALGTRLNILLSSTALRLNARQIIAASDCLLVDITGNNPAVLYCLGVAEALSKPVIIVARHAETNVFQINEPVLSYADEPMLLRTQLISRLSLESGETLPPAISVPVATSSASPEAARFYEIFGDILQQHGYQNHGEIKCENEKTFLLIEQDMDLSLVEDLSRRAKERGLRLKLL